MIGASRGQKGFDIDGTFIDIQWRWELAWEVLIYSESDGLFR
jgi:hypothetical protein